MRFTVVALLLIVSFDLNAKSLTIYNPHLGVKIHLQSSAYSEPLAMTWDDQRFDYSPVVKGINRVIARHTIHCFRDGIMGVITRKLGCHVLGFDVMNARLVPARWIFDNNNPQLILVLQGQTTATGTRFPKATAKKTFFIPLESLMEAQREMRKIHWWRQEGEIHSSNEPGFDHLNIDSFLKL